MKAKHVLSVAILITALACLAAIGAAEDEVQSARLWKPKVTSVSVFKNGLGFFIREAKVSLHEGWCVSDAVPPATFGTLAIYSHEKNQTVDIVGSGPGEMVAFDDLDAPKDSANKRDRLESCMFLNIHLTYRQQGSERTAAGQLVSVGQEYAVLQSDGNNFAVPIEGIRKLQVMENPLRVHVVSDSGESPAETTLGMAYQCQGIIWIPEYTLKLLDDETAELTLRGTLVNEAEDLVHCDVNFVVGVPHFLHTEYLAPIAVGQVIRTIGVNVAPQEVMTQMMNRAVMVDNTFRSDQFDIVNQPVNTGASSFKELTDGLPEMDSTGADDFKIYTRKDLTLRKGEKAIVTLFVKRIKYGHVHRWAPPADIRHFLVLRNETDTPWTTAPCLIINDAGALSEDLLRYVPMGGSGELPVTTAINIAHDQKETETERQLKAHEPSHNYFLDLVNLDGVLNLRNLGNSSVEIVVALRINGKPLTTSDEGTITLDTANLKLVERTGTINWRIAINPGESKTLTYTYERYVPSQ